MDTWFGNECVERTVNLFNLFWLKEANLNGGGSMCREKMFSSRLVGDRHSARQV